jgi:hypothetical protein
MVVLLRRLVALEEMALLLRRGYGSPADGVTLEMVWFLRWCVSPGDNMALEEMV